MIYNVKTACLLSVITVDENDEMKRLVTDNLAELLKETPEDVSISVRILNPKNYHFQPITSEKLIEAVTPIYSIEDIEYLKERLL